MSAGREGGAGPREGGGGAERAEAGWSSGAKATQTGSAAPEVSGGARATQRAEAGSAALEVSGGARATQRAEAGSAAPEVSGGGKGTHRAEAGSAVREVSGGAKAAQRAEAGSAVREVSGGAKAAQRAEAGSAAPEVSGGAKATQGAEAGSSAPEVSGGAKATQRAEAGSAVRELSGGAKATQGAEAAPVVSGGGQAARAAPSAGAAHVDPRGPRALALRLSGRLSALEHGQRALLLERTTSADPQLAQKVAALISDVRARGDVALKEQVQRFDGATLQALEVPRAQWEAALGALTPALREGLERAARNLRTVQRGALAPATECEVEPGVRVGRRPEPLARVGVYAPGGTAAYPSSVLMGVVPAKVAGVGEVIVCSPAGPSGLPSAVVLAAALLSGADRVFALGGAGAIAALAYGTASVPRVDRIVGPGNAWVAEAKRQVAGDVPIDSPAGPSEILVVDDGSAAAQTVARELLAQAEHDPDACCVALCLGAARAAEVERSVLLLAHDQPRAKTVEAALASRGAVLSVEALEEAWPFVEAFAPEHLLLAVADPGAALAFVRNAGTVFLGGASSVAFGDYLTGANHVLPTAGAARRFSGLSAADFVRWSTWQQVTPAAAQALSAPVVALAEAEGLYAHAAAARAWAASPDSGSLDTNTSVTAPPRSAAARAWAASPGKGAAQAAGDGRAPPPRSGLAPRADYAGLSRYSPKRPPTAIDLTDNTNLFGVPPTAQAVLEAAARGPAVTRYPTPYADGLREALAAALGVAPTQVVTGCGSDDVLDSAVRAFALPGEVMAFSEPNFAMARLVARMNGLTPAVLPLTVEAYARSGAKVIYLCAPNNPTGALLPEGFVAQLLARTDALVMLDEAYIEYAPVPSWSARAPQHENLLVVRTLSKAYGLAGLRVGYATGAERLVEAVEISRGPYKVGKLTEQAAIAALSDGKGWVADRVAQTKALRAQLVEALAQRGLASLPSAANFVLLPVAQPADALADRLRARGVAVRPFAALPEIGEALRVTVGPWEQLQAFLDALDAEVKPR